MNKLYLVSLLLFLFISCNEDETPQKEIPEWIQPIIENLDNSGECYGCSLAEINYNNKTYYHLYCSYWSCMYCNLYDSNGNTVEWETEDFSSFLTNKSDDVVIWRCGDN